MTAQPQIGDTVLVRYLGPKPGYITETGERLVILGSERPTLESVGRLNVEVGEDGHAFGIVVEGDGSADFIPRSDIVSVEVLP